MLYLTEVKHIPHGENGVSRTYGHHKSYYLCEHPYNMKILNEYRKSHTIKKI